MSNFIFLKQESQIIFKYCVEAEKHINNVPQTSLFYARLALEQIIKSIYRGESIKRPKENTLDRLISNEDFQDCIDNQALINGANQTIRKFGNDAVHANRHEFSKEEALKANKVLFEWAVFFVNNFTDAFNKGKTKNYDEALIPKLETNFDRKTSESEMEKLKESLLELEQKYNEENILKDKYAIELSEKLEVKNKILANQFFNNLNPDKTEILGALREIGVTITNAGLTEQKGSIWGRVYVNFNFLHSNYFAIKYFENEGGAKEKYIINVGTFEENERFKFFDKSFAITNYQEILDGSYDNITLVTSFSKERYGTPSVLLKRLLQNVIEYYERDINKTLRENRTIRSMTTLNNDYSFYASYYRIEGSETLYRNVLEIIKKDQSTDKSDAIVVMMNPGGSRPVSTNNIQTKVGFLNFSNALVECIPDVTQYQIVRLMQLRDWNKVMVINLFDNCELSSRNLLERFKETNKAASRNQLIESIFHEDRRKEFESVFLKIKDNAPIIIGWGVDDELEYIRIKILNILQSTNHKIVGYTNNKGRFYHPWPKGEQNEHIRDEWVGLVNQKLLN